MFTFQRHNILSSRDRERISALFLGGLDHLCIRSLGWLRFKIFSYVSGRAPCGASSFSLSVTTTSSPDSSTFPGVPSFGVLIRLFLKCSGFNLWQFVTSSSVKWHATISSFLSFSPTLSASPKPSHGCLHILYLSPSFSFLSQTLVSSWMLMSG